MPSIAETLLFFRTLPIAVAAQSIRTEPLPKVVEKVLSLSGRRGVEDPAEALRAAQRACGRWAKWFGGIDTCLTRSLVAGGLLAGNHGVVLHVGFRPVDQGPRAVDGLAWLVVDGEVMELTGMDHEAGEPYETSLQIRME